VDVLGRTVATLVEGTFAPSSFPYAVQFDAGSVASGVYIARMQVTPLDGTVSVQRERKLLVLK